MFDELFSSAAHGFWLDSGEKDRGRSRFSLMGDDNGPWAEWVTYSVDDGIVTTRGNGSAPSHTKRPFLDHLGEQLEKRASAVPEGLPLDFNLGYVGYLGYELKAETEGARAHRARTPDAALLFADRVLVIDHLESVTYALCLGEDENDPVARAWLDDVGARLHRLGKRADSSPRPASVSLPGPADTRMGLRDSKDSYITKIGECVERILDGESYEICLTNTAEVEPPPDPIQVYHHLRRLSPAPYGAFLRYPGLCVLSSSPERFLRIDSTGRVESKPIKGTRPRGRDEEEDGRLVSELRKSTKDQAENLMIVDLLRNDLNKVCETGTVTVPRIFDIESYPSVHHLVSTVAGTLRTDRTAVDCVRAAFPGGSMTGAPKKRTMEIIDRLEGAPRGVYSGALGWFSLSGAADLSIVIRTLVVTESAATFGIGGAITAMSDPEEEFEETMVKSRAIMWAVSAASADTRPGTGHRTPRDHTEALVSPGTLPEPSPREATPDDSTPLRASR